MRKGKNLSKEKKLDLKNSFHRVIIPLYIPDEEGYYKDAYQIFTMCIDTLLKTSSTSIKVSIVANGCCNGVHEKLIKLYNEKGIDELIIENEEIGKINSILKALRNVNEPLVTITDADVLFLNDWEDNVLRVFKAFPKAGAVCPVPVFRKHNNHTYNIWFDYLFSKKMRFTKVVNPVAMTYFANSIGWSRLDQKFKDVYLTLTGKKNVKAMVGCSHFVATYKQEVFKYLPKENTKYLLGGNSEENYLDIPVVKAGGYRLTTVNNYAYHMGNSLDDFFLETYSKINNVSKRELDIKITPLKGNSFAFFIKFKLFKKLITSKPFLVRFYKIKGLSEKQIQKFID